MGGVPHQQQQWFNPAQWGTIPSMTPYGGQAPGAWGEWYQNAAASMANYYQPNGGQNAPHQAAGAPNGQYGGGQQHGGNVNCKLIIGKLL